MLIKDKSSEYNLEFFRIVLKIGWFWLQIIVISNILIPFSTNHSTPSLENLACDFGKKVRKVYEHS